MFKKAFISSVDRRRSKRAGFSLVELLIVAGLVLLTAAALGTALVQGVKMFERLSVAGVERDAGYFFERITRDLRNAADYSFVEFEVKTDRITFASLTDVAAASVEPDLRPVRISYSLKEKTRQLVREESFLRIAERGETLRQEVVFFPVDTLNFDWEGEKGEVPRRVTVSVEYPGVVGDRTLSRIVLIPAGLRQ